MSRSPEAKRRAALSWRREVASATTALALLGLSTLPAAAQVLRDPPTPYHFLRSVTPAPLISGFMPIASATASGPQIQCVAPRERSFQRDARPR